MTAFENYINIAKKRERYEVNIDTIKKLKEKLLDGYDITDPKLIKESVDQVISEQNEILKELGVNDLSEMIKMEKEACSKVDFKNMKKNLYSSMSGEFSTYEKNKKIKEEKEKKIQELEFAKAEAEELIDVTNKAIKSFGNKISEEDIFNAKLLVKELEEVILSDDIDEIKVKVEKLKSIDYKLASNFYEDFNVKNDINEEDIIDYDGEVLELDDSIADGVTEVLTSDMKPNKADDKTDVLTSDMKPNTAEVLYFDEIRREVFKDARIVFDGKYKLYFNKDNYVYEYDLNTRELGKNIAQENPYDYNIQKILREFDSLNNTKLYERYMRNKIPVEYNFVKCEENNVKKSTIKKLKIVTDRQKEENGFMNSKIIEPEKKKKSSFRVAAAAIGVAAITFIGSVIGFGIRKFNSYDNSNLKQTVSTTQEIDNAGASDAIDEAIEIKDTTMINTSFEEIELVSENVMNDVKENAKEETNDIVEEVAEDVYEVRIGDVVTLNDSIDLYHASTDSNANGNTSYLESNNYKISLVSIVDDGEVVKLIDDSDVSITEAIEECKRIYGDDIEVFENLDLLDGNNDTITPHVGWVEDEEFGKVLVR